MAYNSMISRGDASALIPEAALNEIIQSAVQESVVLSLFRRLPDMTSRQTRLPVLSMLPVAYFVHGDTGLKKTTEMIWDNKFITAEELAAIVVIPEAVLDDAGYPIWSEVRPRLAEAIAKTIDDAVFFGINAPASWPTPIQAAAVAAGNSVSLGTDPLYSALLGPTGVISLLERDGFIETAHVASMNMRGMLRDVRTTDGLPIFSTGMQAAQSYYLNGAPLIFPAWQTFQSAVSGALLFTGAFREFVYAIRRDITFTLSTDAVITDPAGNVIHNLFQQDMVALRVAFRMGWQCPNPTNYLQPNETNRYPAAVLLV